MPQLEIVTAPPIVTLELAHRQYELVQQLLQKYKLVNATGASAVVTTHA